jgi:hypothetical protein
VDTNLIDSLKQDPLYNLTNSSAALLSSSQHTDGNSIMNSVTFDIPSNDGASLGFYKDSDSLSTFRSNVRSILKKKREKTSTGTPATAISTPTQSVSFSSFLLGQKMDDTSVSKMSDTASKVATLENRFQQMETQFSSSFARLKAILSGLSTQGQTAGSRSGGGFTTPVLSLANPPVPDEAGGSKQRASGHGS